MKKLSIFTALASILLLGFTSCDSTQDDPFPDPVEPEKPLIILDTDLGNSTDDVFAMQAMFAYQAKDMCKVVGVMQNRKVEKAKDLLDRFMHFYKADNVPVGLVEGEQQFFEITPYYQLVDVVNPDGTPLFQPTGIPLSDRLPAWKLYRKLLSEAQDNSITVVCIGMLTNLGLLLDSTPDEYSSLTGLELVRRKVRSLEIMAGCFSPVPMRVPEPGSSCSFLDIEYNIMGDVPLAKKVIENWPGHVSIMPLEEGMKFPSRHNEILKQYSWQQDNPIYQVYANYDEWKGGDVGPYMWDVVALLHPILGESSFCCSPAGVLSIDDQGVTTFKIDMKAGNAHIVSLNTINVTNMWQTLDNLATFHP